MDDDPDKVLFCKSEIMNQDQVQTRTDANGLKCDTQHSLIPTVAAVLPRLRDLVRAADGSLYTDSGMA